MRVTWFCSPDNNHRGVDSVKNTRSPFVTPGISRFFPKSLRDNFRHSQEKKLVPACLAACLSCSRTSVEACFRVLLHGRRGLKCDPFWGRTLSRNFATDAKKERTQLFQQYLHTSRIRLSPRNSSKTATNSSRQVSHTPRKVETEAAAGPPSIGDNVEKNPSPQPEKLTADDYEKRLRKRMQAAGRRPAVLHRLQDPLSLHLYRVAASRSYRNTRESVLVTGSTLVKELRKHFRCKRLLIGHRTKLSEIRTESASPSAWPAFPPVNIISGPNTQPRVQTEIHRASDRLLKKLAGLHSYSDGILAEMQLPAEAKDFGDIKLLLCLGDPPPPQQLDRRSKLVDFPKSSDYSNASAVGMYGTLLRSAAALHWQGVWILPKCPDVFSPLGTRASQGALFWMPYRTGRWEALLQFAAERQLLLCVPHHSGVDAQSPDLLGQKAKGLCLVVDGEAQLAAQKMVDTQCQRELSCRETISAYGRKVNAPAPRLTEAGSADGLEVGEIPSPNVVEIKRSMPPYFRPDRLLSVAPPSLLPACTGATPATRDGASNSSDSSTSPSTAGSFNNSDIPNNSSKNCHSNISTLNSLAQDAIRCMHPLTLYTLLMYQLKRAQFPSASASSYIFTVKKKQKNVAC